MNIKSGKVIKLLGAVAMVGGAVLGMVSDWASRKQMKEEIMEEMREEQFNSEMESEEES